MAGWGGGGHVEEAVHIFTSSPLNVHWTFRGEGVEESQELDAKVGILGQNQNNALRKHI